MISLHGTQISSAMLGLVVVALFGGRIAPYEPIYFVVEHGADPRPYVPGLVFPLGSDLLGRDLLSLVLTGARATLTIVLVAGLARVLAGVLVAAVGSLWRPMRLLTETVADLVAAVPATLVALILIKAFVKTDTSILVLIGALLLMGWAGPYRVIRAEVDRLARAPFTEGAQVLGVSRARLFWTHHLPHLVPVIAINLTQQVVASLVLVAELGVLGVLVGAVRSINVEESLATVRVGPPMSALVPDVPEWGAMLASSRTVEALWATRWLIFVPGAAFALTASAVAAIGFTLARRYARKNLAYDARGVLAVALVVAGLFVVSGLVPERYAEARAWAAEARAESQPAPDVASAFEQAGLRTYAAVREVTRITSTGPATVTIGQNRAAELYPRPSNPPANTTHVRSVVAGSYGGGVVDAPLVFAARGIVPKEHPPLLPRPGRPTVPPLGPLIQSYPDDYAGIDIRGKVVLLVRFMGVDVPGRGTAPGFEVSGSISDAVRRGAAAVVFVDPELGGYAKSRDPYVFTEQDDPAGSASGVPVVVLDPSAAETLVRPLNLDLSPLLGYDRVGKEWGPSAARDTTVTARVEVPLREDTEPIASRIGQLPDIPDGTGRVVVWAARNLADDRLDPTRTAVLAALARLTSVHQAPFIFVDFDPHADTQAVAAALRGERVVLVLVLQSLDGGLLTFESANGDSIPAFDYYAREVGARYEVTRTTATLEQTIRPLPGVRTVVLGSRGPGGVSSDAVAVIGYLAGRLALGAPELPR
ncbi:MAG: ABC transporter permease subunit [Chloroflexi bacterium]|nr:MAG: ABC transporter permease subunit [Chloroflexota bacterium]